MDFRYNCPTRVISVIVLFFFCWTFGGIFDIAYAFKDRTQSTEPRAQTKQKPEGEFQKAIDDIAKIIEGVGKIGRLEDEKKEKLKNQKAEIEALDVEIRTQFVVTDVNFHIILTKNLR